MAALRGGHYADDAKEALFRRTLAGLPAGQVADLAGTFGPAHYRRRARADVRRRLEWHRAEGHRLVIVSASPEYYVDAVGRHLGVDAVLATRLAVGADGRLTGSYEGRNCRGSEKIDRVRQWMKEQPHTNGSAAIADVLWAYGNSDGDRFLLAGADIGVDVGRLGRLGALRRFRRLSNLPAAGTDPVAGPGGRGQGPGEDRPERRWRRR